MNLLPSLCGRFLLIVCMPGSRWSRTLVCPTSWDADLPGELATAAEIRLGAVWDFSASIVPSKFLVDTLNARTWAWEELEAESELADVDKLFTAIVRRRGQAYEIVIREFDFSTRAWSLPVHRLAKSADQVPNASLRSICVAFAPLVRIERIGDDQLTASVRAGALLRAKGSPRRMDVADRSSAPGRFEAGDSSNGIAMGRWGRLVSSRSTGRYLR